MDPTSRAIRHMYRTDLASFIDFSFRIVVPHRPFQKHWLVDILGDVLSRCERGESVRVIINLPPRYLKSLAVSVAFPAWILARLPQSNILCVGGHQALVTKLHYQSLRLMKSPRYRSLFPHIKASHDGRTIRVEHGGTRTGVTPTGAITGRGADFIIIDDPLPASHAEDNLRREAINQWYDENIYQRLDSKAGGAVIVVMQRLHVGDLAAHLMAQDGWEVISLPAVAVQDETYPRLFGDRVLRRKGEALQPSLESREQLRSAMLRMGAKNFMAQYQQNPYPKGKGEGRSGWYSPYRKGVPFTPKPFDEVTQGFIGPVSEERILLHTIFGEGEHPWPDDMRDLEPEEAEALMAFYNGDWSGIGPYPKLEPMIIEEVD